MKLRGGFVSNSSSSSFCFLGKPIKASSVPDKDLKTRNFIGIGKGLADGTDIFNISSVDMLYFMKTVENLNLLADDYDEFKLYEVFALNNEDSSELTVNTANLPKNTEVTFYAEDQDYHSSTSIADLYRNYVDYFKDEDRDTFFQVFERFRRKDKLIQINNNLNEKSV